METRNGSAEERRSMADAGEGSRDRGDMVVAGERLSNGHEPRRGAASSGSRGEAPASDPPPISSELATVLRDMRARGYRTGYEAAKNKLLVDPFESAKFYIPIGAGRELAFVLELAYGRGFLRGMHDQHRGVDRVSAGYSEAGVPQDAVRRVEAELRVVLRDACASGYERGYEAAAAAGAYCAGMRGVARPAEFGPGDAVGDLVDDATARGYIRGHDDWLDGACLKDAGVRRLQVDYVKEATALDPRAHAELRFVPGHGVMDDPRGPTKSGAAASSVTVARRTQPLHVMGRSRSLMDAAALQDRRRDIGPSR